MGALAASAVVILFGNLPQWMLFIFMVLAAGLAAGLYGVIPAII